MSQGPQLQGLGGPIKKTSSNFPKLIARPWKFSSPLQGTKSAKNDRELDGIYMLLLNLYISIVNRKISWPILVLKLFLF